MQQIKMCPFSVFLTSATGTYLSMKYTANALHILICNSFLILKMTLNFQCFKSELCCQGEQKDQISNFMQNSPFYAGKFLACLSQISLLQIQNLKTLKAFYNAF